jgi:hypothetical protein
MLNKEMKKSILKKSFYSSSLITERFREGQRGKAKKQTI